MPAVEEIKDGLRAYAPAKLNLDLLVGPQREDGYHGLDSLAAKITQYDTVDLRVRRDGHISFVARISDHASVSGSANPRSEIGNPKLQWDIGPDDRNLALNAARLLAEATGRGSLGRKQSLGADIELVKGIPPGTGLGGGASDAAAVLRGLNQLWRLDMSPGELARIGLRLGSDVPLLLGPPCARMTGRGEIIEHIEVYPFWAVLFMPEVAKSTAAVYRAFDELTASEPARHAAIQERPFALEDLRLPPSRWRSLLRNDLTDAAVRICPSLRHLMDRLAEQSRLPVCLTGAGTAMFILCDDRQEALAVAGRLEADLAGLCTIVRRCAD
ncbi:MAG: 4-(cytidine 5'-diphospho)-2-C-methyl-D-erythritol kinase [Phycisphaerae bacterium]